MFNLWKTNKHTVFTIVGLFAIGVYAILTLKIAFGAAVFAIAGVQAIGTRTEILKNRIKELEKRINVLSSLGKVTCIGCEHNENCPGFDACPYLNEKK